jgi:hypothetical protein
MRSALLLFLVLLLPLQMSWAAVHFCNDHAPQARTASAAAAVGTEHEHPADAGALPADPCCAAAHGCHGLHTVMAPHAQALAALAEATSPPVSRDRLTLTEFAVRHERPQWSAA